MKKIKITKVSIGRTVNIGNYESVRLDLEAEVEGNKVSEVMKKLDTALDKLSKNAKSNRGNHVISKTRDWGNDFELDGDFHNW